VLKALSKKPEERYVSAEAMAGDVRRHMSGHPVAARHQTAGYRARLFVRRHRAGLAAAAAIIALVAVYVGTLLSDRSRVQRALAEATLGTKKAEQVTDFMLGLFEASESGRAFSDTVSARALLDRGIKRAREESQPAVRAQMLDVVGRLETSLGEIDRAIPVLAEALAIRRKLYGDVHPRLPRASKRSHKHTTKRQTSRRRSRNARRHSTSGVGCWARLIPRPRVRCSISRRPCTPWATIAGRVRSSINGPH
jgi:serine/threonine-protein kinase